jgi:hypothetical protein
MMQYVRAREQYEDLYDRLTVESARRGMDYYDDFYKDFESKLPEGEKIDRPGNAFLLNVFYMETVGNELLRRYDERENTIASWVARDEAKDSQLENARLTEEPTCRHCSKQGLRIISKDLMHRSEKAEYDDPEDVLITLRCTLCQKNSAFWEDGSAWISKSNICSKCSYELVHKAAKTKAAITFTYSCTSCKYSFKEKLDLRDKKKEVDPNFSKDRAHFCLRDTEFRDRLFKMRHDFLEMARLGKEFKEKEDNKHIYDAIKEMKRPKIAELSSILSPPLKKAGYIEFSLDKPELGKDVFVGFNCLDGKSDRSDRDSEKTLKRTIESALSGTNWRLMSNGINYRLGYLSGRLRAYEREEDLKKLVGDVERKAKKPTNIKGKPKTLKAPDGSEIIL